jgi:hypothetical protein
MQHTKPDLDIDNNTPSFILGGCSTPIIIALKKATAEKQKG